MYAYMAILALFTFCYAVIAGRVEKTPVSGPMLYVAFGVALSAAGPWLEPLNLTGKTLKTLAELTLALTLFTDAANADLGVLRRTAMLPRRLLLFGLPLTILFGFIAAALLFDDLTLVEAAILAVMLAPTDAALGKAVVTNTAVPDDIRDALNMESGLNDGVCVPILFVFLAMAADESVYNSIFGLAFKLVLEEIGIGLCVGLALAFFGARIIRLCARRRYFTEIWRRVPVAALAVGSFAAAQVLGGSGFIAAFAGGLLFGALARGDKEEPLLAAESDGEVMALITWVVFGYAVIGQLRVPFSWNMLLYAGVSLTVARMLPVYLVLCGAGMTPGAKLFTGWFGPRGLASLVFAIIVLDARLPGGGTIALTAVATIGLSILLHGATAIPLSGVFGAKPRSSGA